MSSSVTAFVFTDLMDSTATAARLGPEASEELHKKHFRLLRRAVASWGGTTLKNLGDGLLVMYSSPSRALAGAVGMQQAIGHHNRAANEPLRLRLGISAGEAVEEDGDYFGDPVVEAAQRLPLASRRSGVWSCQHRHSTHVEGCDFSPFHSRRVTGVNGVTHHRVHGVCREERRA